MLRQKRDGRIKKRYRHKFRNAASEEMNRLEKMEVQARTHEILIRFVFFSLFFLFFYFRLIPHNK